VFEFKFHENSNPFLTEWLADGGFHNNYTSVSFVILRMIEFVLS